MTIPTREEIEAMADLISATWPKTDPLVRAQRCNKACAMLRAIAAHLGEREPVAWRVIADNEICDCLNEDEIDVLYFDKYDVPIGEEALGFTVIPLYTTPPADAENAKYRKAAETVLKRYQDARVFTNPHTRQVARNIAEEIGDAMRGES